MNDAHCLDVRELPQTYITRDGNIKTCTHIDEDTASCGDECAQSHVIHHTYKWGLHRAHFVKISHLIWDFKAKFPIKIL